MRTMFAAFTVILMALPVWAAELGDDGLHKTDWFRDTFKDLQEDAAEAKAEGKQLLLIFEQRGCLYCKDMHEGAFMDERVRAHLTNTYYPVQIDLYGATEVVDTDGEALQEREVARKWGVMFTPTMVFMPADVDLTQSAIRQAVIMMPGAFAAGTTYDMMTWVAEERYLDQSQEDFQRYHARMIRERNDGDTR